MSSTTSRRSSTMTADELIRQLGQGTHTFENITVTGDFIWDSVNSSNLPIEGNVTLCNMTFTGQFDCGDLQINGELKCDGSVFQERAALYRITAKGFYASQAVFKKGLGVVNSKIEIAHFQKAHFPDNGLGFPAGLFIKHTSGQLLNLTAVVATSTILEGCDFEKVTSVQAGLGRRTSLTLGELMA